MWHLERWCVICSARSKSVEVPITLAQVTAIRGMRLELRRERFMVGISFRSARSEGLKSTTYARIVKQFLLYHIYLTVSRIQPSK